MTGLLYILQLRLALGMPLTVRWNSNFAKSNISQQLFDR